MYIGHAWNAVVVFWVAIVAIVFIGNFFRYRERTSRHRMIETLAEKGQPIPQEYLGPVYHYGYEARAWRRSHPISSGILLMCVGIALAIFFWAMTGGGNPLDWSDHGVPPNWLPYVGIFPFMVGLARLLAGLLDRPQPPSK